MNPVIHLRGMVLSVVGFGLCFAAVSTQIALQQHRLFIAGPLLALGMAGLVELISGYPFYKVAQKWDSMHGLKRFGLGLAIICMFVVGIFFWAAKFYF